MCEIADERRESNQGEITTRPQEVLHIVAKDEKEIEVANQMDDARVNKKRCEKGKAAHPRRLRGYEPKIWDDVMEVWKGV